MGWCFYPRGTREDMEGCDRHSASPGALERTWKDVTVILHTESRASDRMPIFLLTINHGSVIHKQGHNYFQRNADLSSLGVASSEDCIFLIGLTAVLSVRIQMTEWDTELSGGCRGVGLTVLTGLRFCVSRDALMFPAFFCFPGMQFYSILFHSTLRQWPRQAMNL